MTFRLISLLFIATYSAIPAYAETLTHISKRSTLFSQTNNSAMLGFETFSYLYSPQYKKDSLYQSLNFEAQLGTQKGRWEALLNSKCTLMLNPQVHPYLEAPQAYVGTTLNADKTAHLYFGRKLESWSQLDQHWQLGLWQPRFRWDYLHPDTVGLTGFFLNLKSTNFQIRAFGTPFFIPERGVPLRVENGEFTSPSVWFIPPSSKVVLFDQDTPVRYQLDIPRIHQILFQPAAAIQARVGQAEGLWASSSYALKPLNQLLLSNSAFLQHSDHPTDIHVSATIQPRVAYHHLLSVEAGNQAKPFSYALSLFYERPLDQLPDINQWTSQTVSPALGLSPTLTLELGDNLENPTRFDFSYLRIWGGNAPDTGLDARSQKSFFEARYPFHHSIRLGFTSFLPRLLSKENSRRILTQTRLVYDFQEDGAMISTDLVYRPHQAWTLNLGADFLATDVLTPSAKDKSSFISRYQVNNRIQGGVSYAF